MNYQNIITILELILLFGIAIFLLRFFFATQSKVQKPKAWTHAVKAGDISSELLKAHKKYNDRIRFYNIWMQIRRIEKDNIEGDFAELRRSFGCGRDTTGQSRPGRPGPAAG